MERLIKRGDIMECPKCGSDMFDNTAPGAKKNPKGPDYKCKNKDCNHAIWLKSWSENMDNGNLQKFIKKPEAPVPNGNGKSTDMMRLSYRKDLMLCVYNRLGEIATNQAIKQIFNDLWDEVEK